MAAKIASALDDAITNGKDLEVDDFEFATIREAVTNPTNQYNPVIGRLLLPLFEYIIDAGKEEEIAEN